ASNGVVLTASRGSKLVAFDELASGRGEWKQTADGLNAISPDGRWLAMHRSYTPYLYLYSLPNFERVAKLTNMANIALFAFSPDSHEIAVSSSRGVEFWSIATRERTRMLTNFTRAIYGPSAGTCWLTHSRGTDLYRLDHAEPLLPLPPGLKPLALSPD